jgi:uncharacterized protein Veg
MNREIKFGYSYLGYYTLVKLNVKFTKEQAGKLNEQYPTLLICRNKKDDECSFRIEGCLKYAESIGFKNNLSIALIDYKIKQLLKNRDLITDTINL